MIIFIFIITLSINFLYSQNVQRNYLFTNKTIIVGVYHNEPKIVIKDNRPEGFYIDIIEDIAKKEKWNIIYWIGTWEQCLGWLENGDIDLLPDVAFSYKRSEKYVFNNENLFVNWGVLYTRKKFKIVNYLDLNGKKLGVMKESIHTEGEGGIINILSNFDVHPIYYFYDNYHEIFKDLDKKNIDAGVVNRIFGESFEDYYNVNKTYFIFNPVLLRIAFPTNKSYTKELANIFDRHIKNYKKNKNSIYYKALKKLFYNNYQINKIFQSKNNILYLIIFIFISIIVILFIVFRKEIKNKMEKIRITEEKYLRLAENAPDLIYRINVNNKIEYINKRCYDITGYKEEDFIKNPTLFTDIIYYEDKQKYRDYFNNLSNIKNKDALEIRIIHKSGDIHWVNLNISIIKDNKGNIIAYEGIMRDITNLKLMQEKLINKDKMNLIGELTLGITHDLNNIFTILLMNAELLKMCPNKNKDCEEIINNFLTTIELGKGITSGILSFVKPKELKKDIVELNSIIDNIINIQKSLLYKEGITVKKNYQDTQYFLYGDVNQIKQVFLNMIINARHAILPKNGGTIIIDVEKEDKYTVIKIEDNGVGMDEDTISKIFTPFFSTKTREKYSVSGIGLGLSIVKNIVENHGGCINIISKLGEGTSFIIRWPSTPF